MPGSRRADRLLQCYASVGRGDYGPITEILDDDVQFEVGGEPRLDGIDAVRAYLSGIAHAFSQLRYEIEDLRERADRVLVLVRSSARGRSSGIAIDAATAHVFRFRAERVVHFRVYDDRAEAISDFETG